eukprot:761813-Hanusia_phi.AAC.8
MSTLWRKCEGRSGPKGRLKLIGFFYSIDSEDQVLNKVFTSLQACNQNQASKMNEELLHLQTFALDAKEVLNNEQNIREAPGQLSDTARHSSIIAETRDLLLEGLKRIQVGMSNRSLALDLRTQAQNKSQKEPLRQASPPSRVLASAFIMPC